MDTTNIQQALDDANDQGLVVGLVSTNQVVNRFDIDELQANDPLAFNLYLLALRRIQGEFPDKLGFAQIAGPYIRSKSDRGLTLLQGFMGCRFSPGTMSRPLYSPGILLHQEVKLSGWVGIAVSHSQVKLLAARPFFTSDEDPTIPLYTCF